MENDNLYRVLIVDDDEMTRDLLKSLLPGLGAEVVGEAVNGEEAIEVFNQCNPDITFLDVRMPVMDGVEALKGIIGKDPDAIVVMLTAISDIEVAETCMEAGARNYIRKGAAAAVLRIMLQSGLDLIRTD